MNDEQTKDEKFIAAGPIEAIIQEKKQLKQLISHFCEGHNWAADVWKSQKHIKPLFDAWKKWREEEGK